MKKEQKVKNGITTKKREMQIKKYAEFENTEIEEEN